MHEQYPAAVPLLSLVMPRSSIPRLRSSTLLSALDPYTPLPRNSPLPLLSPTSSRKSSDSWNSFDYDPRDEFEFEWITESLLSRVSRFIRVRSAMCTICSRSASLSFHIASKV